MRVNRESPFHHLVQTLNNRLIEAAFKYTEFHGKISERMSKGETPATAALLSGGRLLSGEELPWGIRQGVRCPS